MGNNGIGACRGKSTNDRGTAGTDYVRISADKSACKAACDKKPECKAIEIKSGSKYCELWSTLPGFTSASTSFQCLKKVLGASGNATLVPSSSNTLSSNNTLSTNNTLVSSSNTTLMPSGSSAKRSGRSSRSKIQGRRSGQGSGSSASLQDDIDVDHALAASAADLFSRP